MSSETSAAPKSWRGRFYEDFAPGDVFESRLGRTITETDNVWFTCLTLNTNQTHFNAAYAGEPSSASRWSTAPSPSRWSRG